MTTIMKNIVFPIFYVKKKKSLSTTIPLPYCMHQNIDKITILYNNLSSRLYLSPEWWKRINNSL